jgi:hypothetical protein
VGDYSLWPPPSVPIGYGVAVSEPRGECVAEQLAELASAVHEDELSECIWQALICAYLGHPGWRQVAEAVFVKHGYTADEIRRLDDGSTDAGGA